MLADTRRPPRPPARIVHLPAPAFMDAWPLGLRPARIVATQRAVGLLYVHPERGGVQLWVTDAPGRTGRGVAVSVGEDMIGDAQATGRLCEAVRARLERAAPASWRWLDQARAVIAQLAEGRPAHGVVGQALEAAEASADRAADRARLEALPPSVSVAVRVMWARRGELVRALDGYRAQRPDEAASASDWACRALLAAMSGRSREGLALAEGAASRARGPEERHAAAAALQALGRPDAAAACLYGGLREGGVQALRLLQAAAEARAPGLAAAGMERLTARAGRPDELELGAAAVVEAGAYEAAIEALERLCEARPTPGLLTRLAELRLWKEQADAATACAERALQAGAPREAVATVLGAAEVLRGRPEAALPWLDEEGEGAAGATARLWRARALHALGRDDEARPLMRRSGYDDRLPWKLWRSYLEGLADAEATFRGREAYQVRIVLAQLFGAEEVEAAYADDRRLMALHRRAIARLGGNYGAQVSLLDEGRLVPLTLVSPRNRAIAAQLALPARGLEATLADFEAQAAEMPDSPYPQTYRSELLLWSGDFEGARAAFARVWDETQTRWAYVGLGAALAMMGRHDEALAAWAEGAEHYEYLPAEATWTYRADVYLALGRVDEALEGYEHAVRVTDTRLGAWLGLAAARLMRGEDAAARAAMDHAAELAPGLVAEVAGRLGLDPRTGAAGELRALVAAAREAMAGNRASTLYTWRDAGGRLRVLPSVPERHWARAAEQLSVAAYDLLVAEVAGRWG